MKTVRICLAGLFTCIGIYLFVSAPPELPIGSAISGDMVSTEKLFQSADVINATARRIYTGRIVSKSKLTELRFDEEWAKPEVEAGPLPALFLRMTAQRLEAKPTKLALFLGSDAPINASNNFTPDQLGKFENIKSSGKALMFQTDEGLAVSMTPDIASAKACVTCHNEHDDSPKKDWEMGDIMGATTWVYPSAQIPRAQVMSSTEDLFAAVRDSYQEYLTSSQSFANPPAIVERWPEPSAYALPSADIFMNTVIQEASSEITRHLFLGTSDQAKEDLFK